MAYECAENRKQNCSKRAWQCETRFARLQFTEKRRWAQVYLVSSMVALTCFCGTPLYRSLGSLPEDQHSFWALKLQTVLLYSVPFTFHQSIRESVSLTEESVDSRKPHALRRFHCSTRRRADFPALGDGGSSRG